MYTISKEFHFSASHQLEGLHKTHPCSRLHGHNYVVIVELQSEYLNDVGFIVDYNDLKPIKEFIDNNLDHRHLNDVFNFNPTAEMIAEYLFKRFKGEFNTLSKVSVKETPKTIASYEVRR